MGRNETKSEKAAMHSDMTCALNELAKITIYLK